MVVEICRNLWVHYSILSYYLATPIDGCGLEFNEANKRLHLQRAISPPTCQQIKQNFASWSSAELWNKHTHIMQQTCKSFVFGVIFTFWRLPFGHNTCKVLILRSYAAILKVYFRLDRISILYHLSDSCVVP